MASEVKTNKISPATGTDVTLGDASDTFTIPASATLDVNGTIDITGATQTGFPSAGFSTVTPFTASSSGWSPASGTTQIIVEVQAGGGGGGGSGASAAGGAGGGGSFAWKRLTVVDTDTMDVVVGSGGVLGGGGVAGATGGTSSFTSASGTSFTAITCVGGTGGSGNSGASTGAGGVGGTVTSASASYDFRMDGTNGRNGGENPGGGSFWGLGQVKTSGLGTAQVGVGYGAGAQGYTASGTAGGATGQDGLVVIWEFK